MNVYPKPSLAVHYRKDPSVNRDKPGLIIYDEDISQSDQDLHFHYLLSDRHIDSPTVLPRNNAR